MAKNDEIALSDFELQTCLSNQSLSLHSERVNLKTCGVWIDQAVQQGLVLRFTRPKFKQPRICLPENLTAAKATIPLKSTDTSQGEEYNVKLLEENGGWMAWAEVAESLQTNFGESMDSRFQRKKVLMNGHRSGKIFLGQSFMGHVVATSRSLAKRAIGLCFGESATGLVDGNGSVQGETSMDFSEQDDMSKGEFSTQSCF
ncbi:hypothetical protein ACA910_000291 [Epithemia clementina (nom. ined.)]